MLNNSTSYIVNELAAKVDCKRSRRGRPCASERHNNELIERQIKSIISHKMRCDDDDIESMDLNRVNPLMNDDDELTKLAVVPFIIKRQRRVRANNRERNRMQTLNEALDVLKEHLPMELLVAFKSREEASTSSSSSTKSDSSSSSSSKRSKSDIKITKIDTLRLAADYIAMLTNLLDDKQQQQQPRQPKRKSPSSSSVACDFPTAIDSNNNAKCNPPLFYPSSSNHHHQHHHHHQQHQSSFNYQFNNVYQQPSSGSMYDIPFDQKQQSNFNQQPSMQLNDFNNNNHNNNYYFGTSTYYYQQQQQQTTTNKSFY